MRTSLSSLDSNFDLFDFGQLRATRLGETFSEILPPDMLRVLLFLCSCAFGFGQNSSILSSSILPTKRNDSSSSVVSNGSTHSLSSIISTVTVHPTSSGNTTGTVYSTIVAPTTSIISNVTTKPHPATTSHVMPATTRVPSSPTPPPPYGNYNVSKNGNYCLLCHMNVRMDVPYHFYSSTPAKSVTVQVPTTGVNVTGNCGKTSSKLVIRWHSAQFELSFKQAKDKINATVWSVDKIFLFINTRMNKNFENATHNVSIDSSRKLFEVPQNQSYLCKSNMKYNVSGVFIHLSDVKLQPFDVNNNLFSKSHECAKDKTTPSNKPNNIVPIAVGCALAGLVLIVLIAYIIGRRKSQRGYEKV